MGEFFTYLSLAADDLLSEFDSTLINGKGRYKGGPTSPLAIVDVKFGLRSALRSFLRTEKINMRTPNQLPTPTSLYFL